MKTIAGMLAVLMLAACGGSEPVAQITDPLENPPLCPGGYEGSIGFGSVECCEPGALPIFPAGTVVPPGTPSCGVDVVVCGTVIGWRLVGNEWVAESTVHGCR